MEDTDDNEMLTADVLRAEGRSLSSALQTRRNMEGMERI
jgi:hypothetical protein